MTAIPPGQARAILGALSADQRRDLRELVLAHRPGYDRGEALAIARAARAHFPELVDQAISREVRRGQSTQVITIPAGGGVVFGALVSVPSPGPFDARAQPYNYREVVIAGSTDFDASAAGLTSVVLELDVHVQPLKRGDAQLFRRLGRGFPAVCELVEAGPQMSVRPRVTGVANVADLVVVVRFGGTPAVQWSRGDEHGS